MGDPRTNLLGLQRRMLAGLASADTPEEFRALVRSPLRDDLLSHLRGRHLVNVRDALARRFPVTASALSLSDAQVRRSFPRLASLARPEARIGALYRGLRLAIVGHERAAVLADVLGHEYALALAKLRGPSSLEPILAAIDGATLDDADFVDLGAVSLQRIISNAPELFLRHDPRDARPLGWPRSIAHVFREGWTSPRWFEFDDLRTLRMRLLIAA
jgi:hypothetical protein